MNYRTLLCVAAGGALALSFVASADAREPGIPSSQKLFQRLDTNKDNQLELSELEPKSEKRFMVLDTNKDGQVSAEEIDAWLMAIAERRKQRILKRMDKNGDGNISRAEVDAYIEALFAQADADSSGGVTIAEAKAYHFARRK